MTLYVKYVENWDYVKKRTQKQRWAQEMLMDMKKEVCEWTEKFNDEPERLSGWGHHYFCEEDGGRLIFHPEKPHEHVCSICGRVYSGGVYDAAWVYIYRYKTIMNAYKSAVLYKITEDDRYLEFCKRILLFYSCNYDRFEEHGRGPGTSGKGKITPQALNEALFLVKIVNILEILKNDLRQDDLNTIINRLLKQGAWFIERQKNSIHNIPCWINAGVGLVGLFTGDEELIYRAFDSEYGFKNQIKKGVTQDYFWYEGSIHYNYFVVESFINLLLFAELYGKEVPEEKYVVKNMLIAGFKYAFNNLLFPNPNDGWPNVGLKTYSFLYEMARKIYNTEDFEYMLAEIYRCKTPMYDVPLSGPYYYGEYSLEALLFGKDEYKRGKLEFLGKSYNFETSNFAILKNDKLNTFIKYGHRGPSHAHPDKMTIEVMYKDKMVTRDLSNSGYGSRLCKEWHRMTISHNTVVVDGKNHVSTEKGRTLSFYADEKIQFIEVMAEEVYPGVCFKRKLKQSESVLEDVFSVESRELHTYDWVFHVEGQLLNQELEQIEGKLGYNENGYQHLMDVKQIKTGGKKRIVLQWDFGDGIVADQTIQVEEGELFLCRSYDNPVIYYRNTVVIRKRGKNAQFHSVWRFYHNKK